jgi:hypothetical protein
MYHVDSVSSHPKKLTTGESHICSGDMLPEQSDTIPKQNHYLDMESNEYHNRCKGKVSKRK